MTTTHSLVNFQAADVLTAMILLSLGAITVAVVGLRPWLRGPTSSVPMTTAAAADLSRQRGLPGPGGEPAG